MAYDPITSAEVEAGKPVKESLMTKVKDNFINHETRILATEISSINKYNGALFNLAMKVTEDSPSTNQLQIEVKQADGVNDPTSSTPSQVSFRSSTLTSGVNAAVDISAALSLTIPAGATLGSTSGRRERYYIYALNNSGVVELAVSMKYYGGGALASSTAISAASDDNGLYSENARTNVPIEMLGYFETTEATAGTWTTSPNEVYSGKVQPTDTIIKYREEQSSGTAAGGISIGWQTRTLNTTYNPQSVNWSSLSSNQITLSPGIYAIRAKVPGFQCGAMQCRLYNTTDTSTDLVGTSQSSPAAESNNLFSYIDATITITQPKTFTIDHYANTAKGTNGAGLPVGSGAGEVYTEVSITKLIENL